MSFSLSGTELQQPWIGFTLFENGIAAPAGVPKDIVLQLNAAVGKAMMLPETQAILVKEGLGAQASPQDRYAAFLHNELVANAKIVRQLGIKELGVADARDLQSGARLQSWRFIDRLCLT
jgi:hypothetical protein